MDVQELAQLKLWRPKPLPDLVSPQVIVRGTKSILFGGEKLFKSLAIEQLGFCLTTGSDWLGFKTSPASVLYVQSEIPQYQFWQRTMKMSSNFQGNTHPFNFVSTMVPPKLDTDRGYKELYNTCAKVQPDVLIIDPIYRFLTALDYPQLSKFYDHIDFLIDQFPNMTLILVGHARKERLNDQGNPTHSGPQDLWGPRSQIWYFDSILEVRGDPTTDDRTLHSTLRHAQTLVPVQNFSLDRANLLLHI
jgi:RecA-family ATPase